MGLEFDTRSQNDRWLNGELDAPMAFARGEVHLQPFEQHGGLPLAKWWRHQRTGGVISYANGARISLDVNILSRETHSKFCSHAHQSEYHFVDGLAPLKTSPQSGLCLTGYTTRFSSFWRPTAPNHSSTILLETALTNSVAFASCSTKVCCRLLGSTSSRTLPL